MVLTSTQWLARLDQPDDDTRAVLRAAYGSERNVLAERVALLKSVVQAFVERFGDRPLRLFRSPGRINLRGMHVDTHGGYLNLMTHQHEVVVAASPGTDDTVVFANTDPRFEEASFRISDYARGQVFSQDWLSFITHDDIQRDVLARRGHWGNYIKGSVLSARHRFPDRPFNGFAAVAGSDLVRGAGLSSSTALSVAVTIAALACNVITTLGKDDLILAVRDAEWFTGARGGISDQAAMLLGGEGELVNVALLASELDTTAARRVVFPDELRVLVINSYTERSLSGAQLVEYTRNRFAYSLALEILRQEMRAEGVPEDFVRRVNRLSRISAESFAEHGGVSLIYRLLQRIPETISIEELRTRYDLPTLDAVYAQYFGTAPAKLRPTDICLRGPLLFGIAESERAHLFPAILESGNLVRLGRLMSIGHDGDRRFAADGSPYRYDVGDAALARLAAMQAPIEQCPGVYGASSALLDALVDAALSAGGVGASLTGAGIAGTVLALCYGNEVERVAEAVRRRLAAPDYPLLASRPEPLSADEIAHAVCVNHATACAGELSEPRA